ncbi:SusD/RagB family nutrient-binding outer membrane lipoprotein [Chitinophaga horti]|uniref:SusD/RagB family nutrient-binding outer membrane lipoprotein n=1 Tax=Chitinophaga horti TaxID=2920382 RepID=A0ABY6J556_9BACT|nr:SusD/RagB family nutrient-binding outer membrane lipoprotein [Chitinophaga horti]UYQ94486.1 SusD/RagB family nutrient-binding outer membrane lipoprotein [Chitinophaga horti]
MKKLAYIIPGMALLAATVLTSCRKDFEEINTHPISTPVALPEQLLPTALANTVTYNMLRNRNFNNELMQVTIDMNDGDGRVFRYDFNRNWSDYLYTNLFIQLTNFKDVYKQAIDPLTYDKTYVGISLISQAWIYSILTDTYGDIPFKESNLGRDSGITEPKFDTQKDVYFGCFTMLEEANRLLNGAANLKVPAADPVYAGNAANWRKFGNSLYLRMLMRIAEKPEVKDTVVKKIAEIAQTKTSTYPIIGAVTESAILRWTGVVPYVNPYNTVREQDFRSPAIASFFIDNLVAWSDPRINISLGSDGINRWGIAPSSEGFKGVPSGYEPGQGYVKKSYFYSNTSKKSMQTEELGGMILNAAEVRLILAEAFVRGYITNSNAQTYYNAGAQFAIQQWLPTWTVTDFQAYMANIDQEWDETLDLEGKLEKIHLQKYYALFMCDMQQWFEYRRTGHPVLPKGGGLQNGGVMPARMTYPIMIQSTNPTNYKIAIANQGPDEISTQVWWQKK